jgi:membrane protein DedA with SNARE-associated domain
MAGLLHMPWWKFLAVEFTTVAITVPLQTGIGYFIGKQTGAESTLEIILWLLGLLALTVAVMLAIHWIVQARAKRGTTPRSKVSWLRTFGRSRKRGTAQAISPSAS